MKKSILLGLLAAFLAVGSVRGQDPAATDFAVFIPPIPQNTTAFASFYPQVPGPIHSGAQVPYVNAQRVGHPQTGLLPQRLMNRIEDKKDRCPCCGYGKTHNDMGVPGHLATKAFYFGGSCEFFSEPCRIPARPERDGSGWSRLWKKNKKDGVETTGCTSCGK